MKSGGDCLNSCQMLLNTGQADAIGSPADIEDDAIGSPSDIEDSALRRFRGIASTET